MKRPGMGTAGVWALFAAAGAAVAVAGFAVALEVWNLTATAPHARVVYDVIAKVRDLTISWQAGAVEVPPGYEPGMTPEGARLFQDHCANCHGAGNPLVDIDRKADAEFLRNSLCLNHHRVDEGTGLGCVANIFQSRMGESADGIE